MPCSPCRCCKFPPICATARRNGWRKFVATFGLLLTIAGAMRFAPHVTPMLVGLYITGAYWFTASTSFANPAVTVARMLTDSFAGIAPSPCRALSRRRSQRRLAAFGLKWLFGKA